MKYGKFLSILPGTNSKIVTSVVNGIEKKMSKYLQHWIIPGKKVFQLVQCRCLLITLSLSFSYYEITNSLTYYVGFVFCFGVGYYYYETKYFLAINEIITNRIAGLIDY